MKLVHAPQFVNQEGPKMYKPSIEKLNYDRYLYFPLTLKNIAGKP